MPSWMARLARLPGQSDCRMIELDANLSEDEWRELHSSYAELRSQVITIKHPGFPHGLWFLRLPEQIATDQDPKTGPYQVGMTWVRVEKGWRFAPGPIDGLDGTVEATISSSAAGAIDFVLAVRNQSQMPWRRALAWLCFNHSHAMEYYRYRNFVCCDRGIVMTPPKTEEHYCLPGHDREWWSKGKVYPEVPFIGTSCTMDGGEPFCVAIAAEEAIMVGQSPGWPCTDIALLFGDVMPGNTSAVRGKIYFSKGTPEEALELYRQDFG